MVTVIDLDAELKKLTMLRGRTPQTTRAERQGSSARLATYRDAGIFGSKSTGKGAWERHPEGDELVQVVDGSAALEIVGPVGPPQSIALRAGMLAIVPRGAWHRFHYPEGATVLAVTPGAGEYVRADVNDPRTVEPTRD